MYYAEELGREADLERNKKQKSELQGEFFKIKPPYLDEEAEEEEKS